MFKFFDRNGLRLVVALLAAKFGGIVILHKAPISSCNAWMRLGLEVEEEPFAGQRHLGRGPASGFAIHRLRVK